MKNRQRNYRFIQISAPNIYCLSVDWVGVLLDTFALTVILSPPLPTSPFKFKSTLRQNNFGSFGSSTAAVPARPYWIVVGFCCYIRLCMIDVCDTG